MISDTELLDDLTELGNVVGLSWVCRSSFNGRGLRLHQAPQSEIESLSKLDKPIGIGENPRQALNEYLEKVL